MVSPGEIAAARAVPIAQLIGAVVALKHDFGLCCFHDERSPSLHIHRASNTFCCFGCGAKGDTIEFVRRLKRLDFASAVKELSGWTAALSSPRLKSAERKAPRETEVPSLVSELWRTATAPNLAKHYLESRGIMPRALPEALRGHRRVWCKEVSEYRPAILAAITNATGALTSVQRIYLEPKLTYDGDTEFSKGARAADLKDPKKTFGPMGSGAAKLAAAGAVLGIAEGVESALAAAMLFRLPVWATCSAGRLGLVTLPPQVTHVVIFGDNDPNGTGRAAAAKAEHAYRTRGYVCQAEFPERGDWCDMVRHG